MEPNKFEKDFREKLNQREIKPSDRAWDRLDAMLSVTEKKQPKKKNKMWYIAASLVGLLLVGTFFFNQKQSTVGVSKEYPVVERNKTPDAVVQPILNGEVSVKEETVIAEKETESKTAKPQNTVNQNLEKQIKNKSNQVAESSIIKKINQEKQTSINQTETVQIPKNENIDQLLDSAEKAVVAENATKGKSKIKINANDLLNQVDGELELSFRERVITKVNKNYQTVKVALANRNQQD